jgi:hypothetical protein
MENIISNINNANKKYNVNVIARRRNNLNEIEVAYF